MKYFDNEQEILYKFRQNIRWFSHWMSKDIKIDVEEHLNRWYSEYDPVLYRRVGLDGHDGVVDAVVSEYYKDGDGYSIEAYIDTEKIYKDIYVSANRGKKYGRNMSTSEGDISEDLIGWIEETGLSKGHTEPAEMFKLTAEDLEATLDNLGIMSVVMGEGQKIEMYIEK